MSAATENGKTCPEPKPGKAWSSLAFWLVLAYAATGFYAVRPNERAVVQRCGRALPQLRGPGLHFGFPYGIDRVSRLKVRERKREAVRMDLADRALGRRVEPSQAERLAGDRNLVFAPAVVQYSIREPKAYLFNAADVSALVRNATETALSSVVAEMTVDDVLVVQRLALQNLVLRSTQIILDRWGAGVQVMSVTLEGGGPPQEVADAFRDVTRAREDREHAINQAQGYANRLIPEARGEAHRIVTEAEAHRARSTQTARGDAKRFHKVAAAVAHDRELTTKRLVLETMEQVLPRLKKVVLDGKTRQALDLGLIEEQE